MDKEQISLLVKIYNTLMTIEVSGKNVMTLATCLNALQTFIMSNPITGTDSDIYEDKEELEKIKK